MKYDLVVIGAGAAGCFAAIRLAEFYPGARICILEAAKKPLSKVEISGGGRCNVTHACFDPEELVTYYPRGRRELLGPFYHFQPSDMVEWFRQKGVILKRESDGRMFPVTDDSVTIINCFLSEIRRHQIELKTSTRVVNWHHNTDDNSWGIQLFDSRELTSANLLIASGSDQRIWNTLKEMGHTIESPVPSLFTFNIRDKDLQSLMGISKADTVVKVPALKLEESGPLLITHWGMSGPAILRLSAWGARVLYNTGYVFDLHVNWAGKDADELREELLSEIKSNGKRLLSNLTVQNFPSRLWKYLIERSGLSLTMTGAEMNKKQFEELLNTLTNAVYRVTGKSTFKEEFVTAGGVALKEIDFKKFESKKQRGLFLAGEVLDIDAITGGFNFQASWTGAFIAAVAIAEKLKNPDLGKN